MQPHLLRHRMNIKIFGNLIDRHIRLTARRDRDYILAELFWLGLRHNHILSGRPTGKPTQMSPNRAAALLFSRPNSGATCHQRI